jgi:Reverse transcriptase (RNA-dependent DNA polymerase)
MNEAKPFCISKKEVLEAYKRVKENKGAAGVDEQTVEDFEKKLKKNLYKIWNRMSSGSYFPPPVRTVKIPKKNGGERKLGIPTVADRIAQQVVKARLEPEVEPLFHADSYGYRPGKSALDAVGQARRRCWRYDWVLDLDIKSYLDTLSQDLLLRAVKKHAPEQWIVLYIERWLKAPVQEEDGRLVPRERGTPQGGVISPLLANLFLHYGAPGETWGFQRVQFPPRQEVQPPHRESSLGSEETTNRTKRRQSDERAVTKVKRLSLVKYLTAGRQHRSGWKAPVGAPQMARWPETAAGSVSTARSDREASRDLGDPLWSWSAHKTDRVCRTIGIIPENGRCYSAKSDSLVVLGARESCAHGEAAKQMKPDFRETSPALTEAGV